MNFIRKNSKIKRFTGAILALSIPSILLSSCSTLTLTRKSFTDPSTPTNPNLNNPSQPDNPNTVSPNRPNPTNPLTPSQPNITNPLNPSEPGTITPINPSQPGNTSPISPSEPNNPNPVNPNQSSNQNPVTPSNPNSISPTQPPVVNPSPNSNPSALTVTVDPSQMTHTELPGADRSTVVINLADNNITLRTPLFNQIPSVSTLQLLKTLLRGNPSTTDSNFIFTNKEFPNWVKNTDKNWFIISNRNESNNKIVTLLNFVLNSTEYQKINGLVTINNNRPFVITRIDPTDSNLILLASFYSSNSNLNNSYLQFNVSAKDGRPPYSIDEANRSITFDNLTLEKRIYPDSNNSTTTVRNWMVSLGRFTIYNAF
ncbi:hypothetical protein [[Mycoplasma] imitans]|uniref:hypothetical protein n=1 Tax=[Mycoplasma] imitans TaxID=29560 RepID=UPI000483CA0A|nr:hypothetical protein [[Mycoplasma] imitans]